MLFRKLAFIGTSSTIILLSPHAKADGLADLNTALASLNGNEPIIAYYEVQSSRVSDADDKDDRKETKASVTVTLTDNEKGLHITYSKEVMDKIENEAMQKTLNEEFETPTLTAVRYINATSMRNLLSASSGLQRMVAKAKFIGEESLSTYEQSTRLLTFTLHLDAIIDDKKTRDYVNKFEGKYTILINSEGVPLESNMQFKGKGSAFVILTVKADNSIYNRYEVVNKRLVRVQNNYESSFSSTFGDNTEKGSNSVTFADPSTSFDVVQR